MLICSWGRECQLGISTGIQTSSAFRTRAKAQAGRTIGSDTTFRVLAISITVLVRWTSAALVGEAMVRFLLRSKRSDRRQFLTPVLPSDTYAAGEYDEETAPWRLRLAKGRQLSCRIDGHIVCSDPLGCIGYVREPVAHFSEAGCAGVFWEPIRAHVLY